MGIISKAGISVLITTAALYGCATPTTGDDRRSYRTKTELTQSELARIDKLPGMEKSVPPSHVMVDKTSPAFTVYIGVSSKLRPARVDKLRQTVNANEALQLIPWDEFLKMGGRRVYNNIRRDDYPRMSQMRAVVSLARRYPGSQWGITWNGGIAFTQSDYRYSERTFKQYKGNKLVQVREKERRKDPVHPLNHLIPLFPLKSS